MSVLSHDVGAYRQVELLEDVACLIDNEHSRSPGLVLGLDNDLVGAERELVGTLLLEGCAFNHVLEAYGTCSLHDGGGVVGIPVTYQVTLDNLVSVSLVEHCSVRDVVL